MPHLTTKPLDWFKPDPKQPRKEFPEAELRRLGESLKARQNDPVQAMPDGTLIDGERRWRAAKLLGLRELAVILTDTPLSDSEAAKLRLTTFFHREDLAPFEKWQACAELMCMNPTWQMKDLAEALHVDPSSVTKMLSPSKCSEEWQQALKEGKVGISDCYAASRLPPEKQAGLLALKLSGASRDDLEQVARKTRTPRPDTIKLARVRCPLSTGTVVVVQGPEMDLEQLIETLQAALEAARKANRESLDVRTFEKVLKDKAKAG